MSRDFHTIDGTTTGSQLATFLPDNYAAILSNHLGTSGEPSYATDGMFYVTTASGSDPSPGYWLIEDGVSVPALEAFIRANSSDLDWNLVRHENFTHEIVTTVPGVLTQGRIVHVDGGTSDNGTYYGCDGLAYRAFLTNRPVHSSTDLSRYHRHQLMPPATAVLALSGSSDISWTTLDVSSVVAPLAHLATDLGSMVLLNVAISDTGGRAVVQFRANGMALDTGTKAVATVAAETSTTQYGQIWVQTTNGVIQYQLDASGSNTATVAVTVEAAATFS